MEKKRVSMREVSRLSGVSIATVSRVIHNNGRFSDETAKRVMEVMNELNYVPDALAQGMRKRTLPVVGIIVPDILDDRFGLMVRVIQERIFESGYSTIVFNSNENGSQSQKFIDNLISSHASGLVYVPDSRNTVVDLKGLPTVFFEREPMFLPNVSCTYIFMNDFEASKTAMEQLMENGARKVLILGDSLGISSYKKRMDGAIAAFEGKDPREYSYMVKKMEPQRTKATITVIEELLEQGYEFDTIFSSSIRMTIGALKVLKDRGLQKKITLLGIGEHRFHEYGLLDYKALREPIEEMANAAAKSIVKLIEDGEAEDCSFVIKEE